MPRELHLRGEVLIKVMISVVFLAKMLGLLWWKSCHSVEHFEKQQCIANNQIFSGNHHVRFCRIESASANHQKTKFAPIFPLPGTQNFMDGKVKGSGTDLGIEFKCNFPTQMKSHGNQFSQPPSGQKSFTELVISPTDHWRPIWLLPEKAHGETGQRNPANCLDELA